jgi:hypothetical protein
MKIKEICACGSSFLAEGDEATNLYTKWVKRHRCPDETPQQELRDVELSSSHQIAIGFATDRLVVPAPDYDPWEDSVEHTNNHSNTKPNR